MDYEKKYKEAIERAKGVIEQNPLMEYLKKGIEYIFPELKESEDDRMRAMAIKAVYAPEAQSCIKSWGINPDDVIAWLEKQGENISLPKFTFDDVLALQCCMETVKKVQEDKELYEQLQSLHDRLHDAYWLEKQDYTFEIKAGHWYKCVCDYVLNSSDLMFKNDRLYYCRRDWRLKGEIDERNVKDIGVNGYKSFFRPATNQEIKEWLEKHGEQKPADKVEPKFNAGDYVVIDGEVLHVKEVTEDGYLTDEGGLIPFRCDKETRLWTIQDVKDGDVLSFNDGHGNDCIELIKSITDLNKDKKIEFWFCLTNNEICEVFDGVCPYTNMTSRQNAKPATKEQRNTLEKAMADAGWEFDFDKKELKEIEQKPAWSEEDEKNKNNLLSELTNLSVRKLIEKETEKKYVNWLKSLKDRYAFKPSEEQITVCKEVYADLLSAKGFDLGTVNSELNRLEEKFKETNR